MAKSPALSDYVRQLMNGEGVGSGSKYKPWLDARKTKTHGVASQTFGIKTGRIHHGLSSHEKNFLYIAEYQSAVIDIREQFPLLPLSLSMQIAEELGIKYPLIPKSKIPIVMTTDFLITCSKNGANEYRAFSVKPEDGLTSNRDLEKQEIERVWWENMDVPWKIFTDNEIDKVVANNIRWLSQPLRDGNLKEEKLLAAVLQLIEPGSFELNYLFSRIGNKLRMSADDVNEIFRILAWSHNIELDLENNILEAGLVKILLKHQLSMQRQKNGTSNK